MTEAIDKFRLAISVSRPKMREQKTRTTAMSQLNMFADDMPPPAAATADVDRVRRKLAAFLSEVREAGRQGLPAHRRRLVQTVVPQMIRWLPEDEAQKTKKAFDEALPT